MNLTKNLAVISAWEAVASLCPSLLFTPAVKVSPTFAPAGVTRASTPIALPTVASAPKNADHFCVCGGLKTSGRLCNSCLATAPDYIREHYFRGTSRQQQNATRWLAALGNSRREDQMVSFSSIQNLNPIVDLSEIELELTA